MLHVQHVNKMAKIPSPTLNLNPQHMIMIHVQCTMKNRLSSTYILRNNTLQGWNCPSLLSIHYPLHIYKLKRKKIVIDLGFFSTSPLFLSLYNHNTQCGEWEKVKKRNVEFVLISQGNILQITTWWENQWKETFPAVLYSICHKFSSMGIFFLTISNEYLIRNQRDTFTACNLI